MIIILHQLRKPFISAIPPDWPERLTSNGILAHLSAGSAVSSAEVSKRGVVDWQDYWYNRQWYIIGTYAIFLLKAMDSCPDKCNQG